MRDNGSMTVDQVDRKNVESLMVVVVIDVQVEPGADAKKQGKLMIAFPMYCSKRETHNNLEGRGLFGIVHCKSMRSYLYISEVILRIRQS